VGGFTVGNGFLNTDESASVLPSNKTHVRCFLFGAQRLEVSYLRADA